MTVIPNPRNFRDPFERIAELKHVVGALRKLVLEIEPYIHPPPPPTAVADLVARIDKALADD